MKKQIQLINKKRSRKILIYNLSFLNNLMENLTENYSLFSETRQFLFILVNYILKNTYSNFDLINCSNTILTAYVISFLTKPRKYITPSLEQTSQIFLDVYECNTVSEASVFLSVFLIIKSYLLKNFLKFFENNKFCKNNFEKPILKYRFYFETEEDRNTVIDILCFQYDIESNRTIGFKYYVKSFEINHSN